MARGNVGILDSARTRLGRQVEELAFAALWLFTFSLPWERTIEVPGVGAAGRLIGMIALGLAFLSVFNRGELRLRPPTAFLLLAGAFTFWSLLSYFWSIAPRETVGRAGTYAQLAAMAWMYWQLCNTRARKLKLMQAFVGGSYVMAALVVYNFVLNGGGGGVRYTALDENQNYLAMTLVLAIPMAWHLALRGKQVGAYWLNLLYIPTALLIVGLAASRGALIMCLPALTLIPLTFSRLPFSRRIALIPLLLAGLYGIYTLVPLANIARLAETSDQITEGDLTHRVEIWKAGLDIYRQPSEGQIVGRGSGTFSVAVFPELGFSPASHNSFLSILLELGLVGEALFLAMLGIVFLPLWALPPTERWLHLTLGLTLLVGMIPANWDYERVTWFVLSLLTTGRALVIGPQITWFGPRTGRTRAAARNANTALRE